jgi:hypothetical protein
MRVLIGPLAEARLPELASDIAAVLAGPTGTVISLRKAGVPDLSRLLSEAEVVRLREAMLGSDFPRQFSTKRRRETTVGYVGFGSPLARPTKSRASAAAVVVAVTDHADLTWRSPLTGPNDDRVGPRFPGVAGVYDPEEVESRLRQAGQTLNLRGARDGMIVIPGIVAGVRDESCLSDHEAKIAETVACAGASSELAPVAVVAAHLGLQVAAAVVTLAEGRETSGGGS